MIAIIVIIGIVCCWLWIRVVNAFMNPLIRRVEKDSNNPYIAYHKLRKQNDKNYERYLAWMDKNNEGLPIEKIKSEEEEEFENKMKEQVKGENNGKWFDFDQ